MLHLKLLSFLAALPLIYANVILYFLNHVINGHYSMANCAAIILPFCVLNAVFVIAFWQCPCWARDIASGTASLGSNGSGLR